MATNTLNTRIQLKYDSYTAWEAVKETFKPLKGEICIVNPGTKLNDASAVPCLMKVGDGDNFWKDLPWVSAIAADVYAWAKKSTPDWNDFPALPITVSDTETGKFVTDIEYSNNVVTIHRADVAWDDVTNKPDVALKSDLPTELGVMSVKGEDAIVVTGDKDVTIALKIARDGDKGNVTLDQFSGGLIANVSPGDIGLGNVDNTSDMAKPVSTAQAEAIAAALAEAKKYADDNDDNDNTAHTHVNGTGTVVTAAGGIDGEVAVNLNIGIKLEEENLVIFDKTSNAEIATMSAADFVEDSYLSDVTVDDTTSVLKFTFTLNDGTTKEVDVDLTDLVDVYTGEDEGTVKVSVDGYAISAEVREGTLKNEHIADDAAIAASKIDGLATVATSGAYADLTGLPTLGALAAKDTVAEGDITGTIGVAKITNFENEVKAIKVDAAAAADTATKATQDGDGNVITATYAKDADLAAIAKTGNVNDLVQTTGDYLIFNCGSSTTVI